jgi:hypothetical protein
MYVKKNCKACGDLIEVRLADHKRGWGNFCDKRCAAAWKGGERPRSINAYHASCVTGGWAYDKFHEFQKKYPEGKPPQAPSIKSQTGRRQKITQRYHSPSKCRTCGENTNGPGDCDICTNHKASLDAIEQGWDGHKA